MNNNLENLFKNKFENFEQTPNPNLWNKINKNLNKFSFIKTASIIVSFAVVVVATIMFLPKSNIDNTIITPNNSNSEISNVRQIDFEDTESIFTNNQVITKIIQSNSQQNNIIVATSAIIHVEINPDESETIIPDNTEEKSYEGFELSANKGCCPLTVLLKNQEQESENLTWKINNTEYKNSDEISISLEEPGTYEISLTRDDDGTINTYTDIVTVIEQPVADFLVPDELLENKTVTFENNCQEATSYTWYINNLKISKDSELSYRFSKTGTYKVQLIASNEDNCSDTVSKNITIEKATESIIFPTAFAPSRYGSNGGYYSETTNNEIFYPKVFKDVKEYSFTILDKQGQQLFTTNDVKQGWDGYYQNKIAEVGVYVYYAKGTFADGEEFQKQGSVTVIYSDR